VEEGHLQQIESARRLSARQVPRSLRRLRQRGDRAVALRFRGRRSNRKMAEALRLRALQRLCQEAFEAGFGPSLATEHLASQALEMGRETLRKWM
jgi:hypothetical protein